MCGLYSFRKSAEETRTLFNYHDTPDFPPRSYVAPGGPIAIVRIDQGQRRFALVRWGFVPSWTKEIKPGKPLINARGETVVDKPSFRNAMKRRRCLIPADGFYEWKSEGTGKTPWLFRLDSGVPFAFAGLWERREAPGAEPLKTFAIVTTSANDLVREVHARMPVILDAESEALWRRPGPLSAAELERCLAPFDAAAMEAWPVSTWVNTPAHDGPRCVEPAR